MAYSPLYWPSQLPTVALEDGFSVGTPGTILRTSQDKGAQLQRRFQDIFFIVVSCKYLMNRQHMDGFLDFYDISAARSFWMPFPDPNHRKFTEEKWWYARIASNGGDIALDVTYDSPDRHMVPLTLEFWKLVPGVTPPPEGKGRRYV